MRTIADIENPNAIIGWWNTRPNEQGPYLYQSLTDLAYSTTDDIEMLYGSEQPRKMLSLTADDSKAIKRDNIGFENDSLKVIPFKNYKAMNEKRRNEIKKAITNNANAAMVKAITETQYKDPATLLRDALFTRETLFMQALTTGKIHAVSDGLEYNRDFHLPSEHIVTTGTPWGNTDSSPLRDIRNYKKQMLQDNGTKIAYALMNGNTFLQLSDSGEVYNSLSINKTTNNIAFAQTQVTKLFTETLPGVEPLLYDGMSDTDYFIPDGMVILLPAGGVGRMVWTDTNEDLGLAGDPKYQLSRTSDGITLYTKRVDNPVATMTHVSQKVLPAIDKIRNIMIMNVGGTTSSPQKAKTSSNTTGTTGDASKN